MTVLPMPEVPAAPQRTRWQTVGHAAGIVALVILMTVGQALWWIVQRTWRPAATVLGAAAIAAGATLLLAYGMSSLATAAGAP